ncbi:MBL fold metallo-hydrolase, partial [candidate division KSB3 bacterium]|nr:MBL fold metallo-hydrolase [candidate division KSB3 bacterium]MBD3326328.1 MBL fold metallo-hydrolase [candidate division KSB3 bacterium]
SMLQRALFWLGTRMAGASKSLQVTTRLEDGDQVEILGGLKVLHTPGHTPGSICVYQEARGIVFCGDLLFNGHPFTGRGGLRYAPRIFSVDPEQAQQSAHRLSELAVEVLCVGHGEPLVKDAHTRIEALIQETPDSL